MDVRSSLSKRLMAWSNDLYIAAEIRWVMSLFRSIDLPSNWEKKKNICMLYTGGEKVLLFFFFFNRHRLNPSIQVCLMWKWWCKHLGWLHYYLRGKEGNVEHNSFSPWAPCPECGASETGSTLLIPALTLIEPSTRMSATNKRIIDQELWVLESTACTVPGHASAWVVFHSGWMVGME